MNLDKETKILYRKLIQETIQETISRTKEDNCLSFRIISPVASFCGVQNKSITRHEYLKILENKLQELQAK
jgi:hypothetical protein